MDPYRELQEARNRESRDGWARFAGHRAEVTRRIEAAATDQKASLCLLGAGNANDIDLQTLIRQYSRIELVDLDSTALQGGVQRQDLSPSRQLTLCEVDVTGGLARLDLGSRDQWTDVVQQTPEWTPERFSVVVSVCLLSQLVESMVMLLGATCVELPDAVIDLRRQHLRCLASLLKPGGRGILITDFVSNQTCPELAELDSLMLAQAAKKWIEQNNFFMGTNPFAIRRQIENELRDCIDAAQIQIDRPWKWDLGPRVYAVSAVSFRKQATA
ncbi:MAG: hypothetical protein P8N76_09860 [Pirellulaceae bacterium]|nr:hypothetical protein [Pirellulaceae bacterium]